MVHSGLAAASAPKCDNGCKCSLDWKYDLGETIKIMILCLFAAQENTKFKPLYFQLATYVTSNNDAV